MADEEGSTQQRLKSLENHLRQENPLLVEVVGTFRTLDRVGRRLGFLDPDATHVTRVPWWPLISVLGLYSAGKSTFINRYLGHELQTTGSQAVDEKFTVICFGREEATRVLPGLALDADPRLPFYQISEAIEEVAAGEGQRIDAYVQLKTCPSEKLRGKIFIDSPGFDADAERSATLRITDHIIDLSDLVLVFFDARHPETGSMRETLEHLVRDTIHRHDSNKFLYILNQIDNAAREDNPEQVFAAWQRALAQHGLTAGRCYSIYDARAAVKIEDPDLRARFEKKREADLAQIVDRVEQVGVERAYRIVGMLHHTAHALEKEMVPFVVRFLEKWRRRVLLADGLLFGGLGAAFLALTLWGGYWDGLHLRLPFLGSWGEVAGVRWTLGLAVLAGATYVHFRIRRRAAKGVARSLLREIKDRDLNLGYLRSFEKNTRWWRSLFRRAPAGWGGRSRRDLARVVEEADGYVQELNDRYTNPSGQSPRPEKAERKSPWDEGPLVEVGPGSAWGR